MRNFVSMAAVAGLLLAAIPAANASVQNYRFSGTIDSGYYLGERYSGSLSFDDAGLLGVADEWATLSALKFSFLGHDYALTDADSTAEAAFSDGNFVGVSYSVSSGEPQFSLIAGVSDVADAFLAYDSGLGLAGAGTLVYATVPEPDSCALLLAGLGALLTRRRRAAPAGAAAS